jgi:hypothetical protein
MTVCQRGLGQTYFPGVPEGFPNKGDVRVARALVRMARMLHGFVEPSSRRPGHELRLREHRARIRSGAGRGRLL